jgi:hypothetical protein
MPYTTPGDLHLWLLQMQLSKVYIALYHARKNNPLNSRSNMGPMLCLGFGQSWSCKRIDEMTNMVKEKEGTVGQL